VYPSSTLQIVAHALFQSPTNRALCNTLTVLRRIQHGNSEREGG